MPIIPAAGHKKDMAQPIFCEFNLETAFLEKNVYILCLIGDYIDSTSFSILKDVICFQNNFQKAKSHTFE